MVEKRKGDGCRCCECGAVLHLDLAHQVNIGRQVIICFQGKVNSRSRRASFSHYHGVKEVLSQSGQYLK